MARCAIPFVLQSPVTGSALVGDKFTFTKHVVGGTLGSGEAATIYTTETEATTTGSNVLTTDSRGSLTQGESASPAWACYWIAPATYDILISGAGLKSVYIVRDLVSGEEESVGTSLLANLAVTTGKLAGEAVTDAKVVAGRALVETGNAYVTTNPTKAECEAGVSPSATRMAFVVFAQTMENFEIGGHSVLGTAGVSYLVPPGVKWKTKTEVKVYTILI